MDQEIKSRLGWGTAVFMVALAVLFDLISFLPIINIFSTILFWLIIGVWLMFRGVSLLSARRLITTAVSMIIELVPIFSWLPATTVSTIAIILMVKSEDKMGLKLIKK